MCPRCKSWVMIYIPHECDLSICIMCNGYGVNWSGGDCSRCGGDGKTKWIDDDKSPAKV